MTTDHFKQKAARAALDYVQSGMQLGLGTGSTADHFTRFLGERVKEGLSVICVTTSKRTAILANEYALTVSNLDETPHLDLTVDGADEIDENLNLIKGGGGALLHEKIIATASKRMIVIADHTKQVKTLGTFPLPIEIIPFGATATRHAITTLCHDFGLPEQFTLRCKSDRTPYVTDSGHWIIDASFEKINEPRAVSEALLQIPGVVDHGLFLNQASVAIVVGPDGLRFLDR